MEDQGKLRALAHRVGLGDKDAALAFQAELEPGLTRIIHRVLRGRCRNPALQARILTEVSVVSKQSLEGRSTGRSTNQKEVAAQVARLDLHFDRGGTPRRTGALRGGLRHACRLKASLTEVET